MCGVMRESRMKLGSSDLGTVKETSELVLKYIRLDIDRLHFNNSSVTLGISSLFDKLLSTQNSILCTIKPGIRSYAHTWANSWHATPVAGSHST